MTRGDADLVLLRPARLDVQEHIVRVAERGDGQPVRVQVCRLVQGVDEPQPQDVAWADAQRRRYVAPVVDRGPDRLTRNAHGRSRSGERQVEHAAAARYDGRLMKRLPTRRPRVARTAGGER